MVWANKAKLDKVLRSVNLPLTAGTFYSAISMDSWLRNHYPGFTVDNTVRVASLKPRDKSGRPGRTAVIPNKMVEDDSFGFKVICWWSQRRTKKSSHYEKVSFADVWLKGEDGSYSSP